MPHPDVAIRNKAKKGRPGNRGGLSYVLRIKPALIEDVTYTKLQEPALAVVVIGRESL
jgi:hypothetical protein